MKTIAIRNPHPRSYTKISNEPLRDKNLSLKARGLLVTTLSHAPGYDISIAGLRACLPEGRDCIRTALNELITKGYAKEYRVRDASGAFSASILYISEQAIDWPETPPELDTENPVVAPVRSEPRTENPVVAPVRSEPRTENPEPAKPQESIKNTKKETTISISRHEREKIELYFHSQGYVEWAEITDKLVASRTAIGWLTNAGLPITDKVSYAKKWIVSTEMSTSFFASEEAAAVYKKLYTALCHESDAHILTEICSVQVDATKNLVLWCEDKKNLQEFLVRHEKKIKPLVEHVKIMVKK